MYLELFLNYSLWRFLSKEAKEAPKNYSVEQDKERTVENEISLLVPTLKYIFCANV